MRVLNVRVLEDIERKRPLNLNLGGGPKRKDGFYTVDLVEMEGVDILADLNEPLTEIPDGSVGAIYSSHAFEHIRNFSELMKEIYRICSREADIEIVVPHYSNVLAYSDPTHVRVFGLYTMYYFVRNENQPKLRKVPDFYGDAKFIVNDIRIDFYRMGLVDRILVPIVKRLVNMSIGSQFVYERRFSWIFPAWQIRYRLSKDVRSGIGSSGVPASR